MPRKAKKLSHGGARKGAGRPATGHTVKPLQLHLPPDVVAMMDAARGSESRSRWVAALVRKASEPSSA